MAGRQVGTPKTGGRVKGRSLDKGERQLVTSQMAGDILAVYKKLGGVRWLLKFAEDNPAEFLRQGLSRLFPPMPKDDEVGATYNQQINVSAIGQFEQARRVAFALNMGIAAQRELESVAEITQQAYKPPLHEPVAPEEETYINPNLLWQPPTDAPEPVEDPDIQRWASELPMTEDQRRDAALVRQTKEANLSSYAGGSPGEQGGNAVQHQPVVNRKPTASELCRRLSRRGRDLL